MPAQNQEWEEKGIRSLKNIVMGTDGKVGGGVRQGAGAGWKPKCVSAGDRWGGRGQTELGKTQGDAGKRGCKTMWPCFCGCVIALLQAGSRAAEPHRTSV